MDAKYKLKQVSVSRWVSFHGVWRDETGWHDAGHIRGNIVTEFFDETILCPLIEAAIIAKNTLLRFQK